MLATETDIRAKAAASTADDYRLVGSEPHRILGLAVDEGDPFGLPCDGGDGSDAVQRDSDILPDLRDSDSGGVAGGVNDEGGVEAAVANHAAGRWRRS